MGKIAVKDGLHGKPHQERLGKGTAMEYNGGIQTNL